MTDGPHQGQPVEREGTPLENASAAMVLAHGRGATAAGILDLVREVDVDGVAALAPQAARNEWYPQSFLAPTEANQPGLDSGLDAVGSAIETATDAGIPHERVLVGGFSQGGCLATEYAARNPQRYGAIVALSGGLIGETVDPESYDGSVDGTPVFLGCSDRDPHIPLERVHETRDAFEHMEGDVDERIYEGMGHTVNRDELDAVAALVEDLVS